MGGREGLERKRDGGNGERGREMQHFADFPNIVIILFYKTNFSYDKAIILCIVCVIHM